MVLSSSIYDFSWPPLPWVIPSMARELRHMISVHGLAFTISSIVLDSESQFRRSIHIFLQIGMVSGSGINVGICHICVVPIHEASGQIYSSGYIGSLLFRFVPQSQHGKTLDVQQFPSTWNLLHPTPLNITGKENPASLLLI